MATNVRNRISMQAMRNHVMEGSGKGSPFFPLWVGGDGEGFFQVVFGVESELSIVHFPCKLFFHPVWGGEGGAKSSPSS